MAKSRQQKRRSEHSTEAVEMTIETRIDPPHVAARPDSPEPVPPIEDVPTTPPAEQEPAVQLLAVPVEYAGQRLRKQADQLATHLRTRQKEIDYREAQLNAQMAQIDHDARTARMWFCEKESALEQRARELDQREQEIKVRLGRVAAEAAQHSTSDVPANSAAIEAERARREDELNRKEAELAARELALAARQQGESAAHSTSAAGPAPAGAASAQPAATDNTERRATLLRVAEELEGKQQDIHRAESQLAQAYAETEKLRLALVTDRARIAQENDVLREQWEQEHRRTMAEVEKQRKIVERRSEHVDRTKAALRQLRVELGKIHRETLEAQLATEELWIQLSESTPSATLTRALGRIRARLAEQYRLVNTETQTEKEELEKLREQLTQQYDKLVEQKREVERWAVAKHEEAERHAARLIARERQLEDQHYELQEQAQRLQAERLSYHRAVRRIEVEQPEHPNPSTAG